MTHPTILVTGATGKTGAAVAAQVRERGWPVRAIVRARDARSERLDRLGVETVVADLFDPEQLLDAMRGTTRAYYCPPFHPSMLQSAAAFAVAAREARLESIVGLSQWLAGPSHPSLQTRQHWLSDALFSMIPGIAHTTVNPGFFAEYPYMRLMGYAAHLGIFPMPVDGSSRNAPPSNDDIARVCVAALLDPAAHAGKTYRPTGPESLSVDDMVEVLSRVLGRKVRHMNLPLWLFAKAARADGTSVYELDGLPYYLQDHSDGAFEFGGPTSDVFDVTGRRPEDFETLARRYAALPDMQRSFEKTVGTFLQFMTIPFRPGFDRRTYGGKLGYPMPAVPRAAMKSEAWLMDHLRDTVSDLGTVDDARELQVARS